MPGRAQERGHGELVVQVTDLSGPGDSRALAGVDHGCEVAGRDAEPGGDLRLRVADRDEGLEPAAGAGAVDDSAVGEVDLHGEDPLLGLLADPLRRDAR